MKTEWCEHRRYMKNFDVDNWSYCPFCGAERPKEPKKLETIIFDMVVELGEEYSIPVNRIGFSEKIAKACIDVVCEVIDERIETRAPNSDWTRSLQDIKKAIRDKLL